MSRTRNTTPTRPESPRIHTPLTIADRDAFDRLVGRIQQHALLVEYTLSTDWRENDLLEDCRLATLEGALVDLSAAIVADVDALRGVLTAAEKRTGGAR